MHIYSGSPLYCAEARQRWYYYPPPYWTGSQWAYATPWLYLDGDKHGSWQYSAWETKIVNRMAQLAPVTVTMWGDYSSNDGNGTIYAQFRNDSTATLVGRALFVITEDSLYYVGSNGDPWHNHVTRDYLPDHIGQLVTVPQGDSVTVSQPFTIQTGWIEDRCNIIAFFQDTIMQPDTVLDVWQGGIQKVMELIGVEEEESENASHQIVIPQPNPCVNGTEFNFDLPVGTEYQIDIFDVCGRQIRTIQGIARVGQESVRWNRRNDAGSQISAGVYLFRFESKETSTSGKIVVR